MEVNGRTYCALDVIALEDKITKLEAEVAKLKELLAVAVKDGLYEYDDEWMSAAVDALAEVIK